MAGSFKTPCPSCEADVLVKGPNLIGKKIDCAKCKYRFTVPSPDGDADDGFEVVETKKKGNPKALIGIVLGVIGVAVLAVGGFMMFGGESSDAPKVANTGTPRPRPAPPPEDKGKEAKSGPETKTGTDKDRKGGSEPKMVDPTTLKPKTPTDTKPVTPVENLKPVDPAKMKDASNLLPGQSVAVMRAHMDRLRQTPIYSAFFDKTMMDFFQNSMTFEAQDMESVHFCLVDADRLPFAVIRTKKPISLVGLTQRLDMAIAPSSPINQRDFFVLKTNAFVTAVSRALSAESLRKDAGIPVTDDDKKRWQEKPLGLHYYDSQTLMIGELNTLARFLSELDKNGDPPFQVHKIPTTAPADPAAAPAPAPADPRAGRGAPGKPPEAVPAAGDPANPNPQDGDTLYSDKPTFLSLRPEMKAMFNRFDMDPKNAPALAYVDLIDHRLFEFEKIEDASTQDYIALVMSTFFKEIKIIGISLNQFSKNKLHATVLTQYLTEDDLKKSVERTILPLIMSQIGPLVAQFCGTNLTVTTAIGTGGDVGGRGGAGRAGGQPGGGQPGGDPEFTTKSKITITNSDVIAVTEFDITPDGENYARLIQPMVVDVATQMKGRMQVLSGETTWHSLSTKFVRLANEKKEFPRGTLPRDSKPERFGLPYPPDQRASFIVELLPYLGRGGLRSTIQEKKFAWYDKQNMKAASTWVPELLVPYYPQSAWRAFHPLADNGQAALGATNFVALAGLGRDAARMNPNDPKNAKLMGITGYEWGSKPAQITDGMSNTIFMIQAPPGHNRPWIAGGGATVMGVDAVGNPMIDFVHTEPSGKRGTYALMADGSVRHLPDNIDPNLFRALVTRAGGETLDDLDRKLPKLPVPKSMEAELTGGKVAGNTPPKKGPGVDAAEMQKLQGNWKVTYLVREGKPIPAGDLDALEMTVAFDDVNMTLTTKDGSQSVIIRMLDPKADPKQITFQNEQEANAGTATVGVYVLEDNKKLRIRYVKNSLPDQRPKAVKVPENDAGPNDGYIELIKDNK